MVLGFEIWGFGVHMVQQFQLLGFVAQGFDFDVCSFLVEVSGTGPPRCV